MWRDLSIDAWEKVAKIFSLIAMPFIIGVGGWYFQVSQSENQLRLEYLKTSIDILKMPISGKDDDIGPLRYWAAENFSSHTDVKLSRRDVESLAKSRLIQTIQVLKYDKSGRLVRVLAYPRKNPYVLSAIAEGSIDLPPKHGSIDEKGFIWVWSEELDIPSDLPFQIPNFVVKEFDLKLSE